ncbi:terpenoid cyclases/protein prenyltransferase alpha-alpha toroid [Diplogelasinospora grovesii]|uniref:Terpenoid cyclases/protein prenyltransferase alpha-alpha toroid n=1 Tax=Diplogelasinospora grovesii TaxID=303347 RepID=A0AAN6NBT3_9PEZI|nr:terpenoid cyclases/protein prenyltransferase alpha-alpha toroid [Diplogelasinospora grovesii]
MADDTTGEEPSLDADLHLKYWKRCLRSPLPSAYLTNESNRMALSYFILNSIDMLTPTPSTTTATTNPSSSSSRPLITPQDRRSLRDWVLSCQHAGGGFCGSPTLVVPAYLSEDWDFKTQSSLPERSGLANIAATVFALQLLALLSSDCPGDGGVKPEDAYRGVDRVKTLRWLRKLQRPDGSFGEALVHIPGQGEGGWFIGGGKDMRYCYLASVIRWILRGDVRGESGDPARVEDFDTQALARYILSSQTYDGGFAESSMHEPHAGYAYCAISALSLLDRPLENNSKGYHESRIVKEGIKDMPGLVHWLASRQFIYLEPSGEEAKDEDEDDRVNFYQPPNLAGLTTLDEEEDAKYVGFNGRCNKVADTCYCWWVGGALANLGREEDLITKDATRRFLLEKAQHRIGGFGKHAGSPPDVYHACFGLAALAIMDGGAQKGMNEFDSSLAVTVNTVRKIEKARKGLLQRAREEETQKGSCSKLGKEFINMGLSMYGGAKPAWLTTAVGE